MEVKQINQEREVQFLTDIDGVVWLKVFASLYIITDWMVRKLLMYIMLWALGPITLLV